MPSTITHEYHYRDVYDKTSETFKKTYDFEFYMKYSVVAQGHDAMFFSKFWEIHRLKKRKDILLRLGNENFKELCVEIIRLIREKDALNSKEIKLILYGYIIHHILDSVAHPYIIYCFEKEDLHADGESSIDKLMIGIKEGQKPNTFPVHRLIKKMPDASMQTKEIISEAFKNIYGIDNFGNTYISALRNVPIFLRLFRYDPTGIKKFGYNIIDSTHLFNQRFSWLSYKLEYDSNVDYLNQQKKLWINPIDSKIQSTSSFLELYDLAVDEAAKIISSLEEAIINNVPLKEINKIIPNVSSLHGLECGKKLIYTNLK